MKLAILGSDADVVRLAAAARDAGHELVWLGDIRSDENALLDTLAPDRTVWKREWELLLAQGVVDGVIVGRGLATAELRAEQLIRLVTEAVPLLITHPIFESVLPYYEIDMKRRETGSIVQHFNPMVGCRSLVELATWVRNGHPDAGKIQQIACERHTNGASRSLVLAHLARDIEVLAAVAGDIRRVSAIGPASRDASFASLQVQLMADHVPALRWSVGLTTGSGIGLQLSLLGERGSVTLRQSDAEDGETTNWRLEASTGQRHEIVSDENVDAARFAIDRLAAAINEATPERRAAASTWETATRDMEVVDAVELSLQKGRTIEVFQQQLTERLAFRGTMAALGCGLLLLAFFAVIGIATLGVAEGLLERPIARAWPLVLFAMLAFYLLLQAVPLLAVKSKKRE